MTNKDKIIGLDISTSCTGISLIDKNTEELLDWWYLDFKPLKTKSLFVKLDHFKNAFIKRISERSCYGKPGECHFAVEEAAKKFMAGKSSANTIATLSQFNFGISYELYGLTGQEPAYIVSTSARKACGIKFPKGTNSKGKKEFVRQWIERQYPQIEWELNRNDNVKEQMYDVADSIVIAVASKRKLLS